MFGSFRSVLFGAATASTGLPTHSLDLTAANSYLSMTSANFGTSLDSKKLAFSGWIKVTTAPAAQVTIFRPARVSGVSGKNFTIQLTTAKRIVIQCTFASSGSKTLTAQVGTALADNTWAHVYCFIDTSQVTSADRAGLYVNGVLDRTADNMGGGAVSQDDTFSTTATNAANMGGAGDTTSNMYLYQGAFFSANLPSITDLYNAGNPKSVVALSGLYCYTDVVAGDVTTDGVLVSAWTNNNSVASSLDIP